MLKQPAAPIEAGNSGAAGVEANNPYGTAPYTPPTTTTAPYTPPATAAGGTGAYVPSYAPVDINAATHTVVRGDTVFNIAKRYQITQDNLRAWNNLGMDNNIQVGQTLRVKPAGYVAPPTAVVVATPPTNTTPVTPPPTSTPPVSTTPPPVVSSNAGVLGSVIAGVGPAVMSERPVASAVAAGQVKQVPIREPERLQRTLHAVWPSGEPLLGAAADLLEAILGFAPIG